MSVCLTKTEIIGGSVDGTVRTFDMRIGRYEVAPYNTLVCVIHQLFSETCVHVVVIFQI